MTPRFLPVVAALAWAVPAFPQTAARPEVPGVDALGIVEAVIDEYDTARRAHSERYRSAMTEQERAQIRGERPDPDAYVPRLLELARLNARTEAALLALVWVVEHTSDRAFKDTALKALVTDHIESPALADVCEAMALDHTAQSMEPLRKILEGSPHAAVRGLACYALAGWHKRQGTARDGSVAPEHGEWLERHRGDAEALYERVAREFADLPGPFSSLGEAAEHDLFELRRLQVGMIVPDIEGTDTDDVAFKLSDYRGKVVVLAFWGHW